MINKYGNDAKNNIMHNIEYPFIPECTNKYGVVLHEGDHVILDVRHAHLSHIRFKGTIEKIYSNDYIYVYGESEQIKKGKRVPISRLLSGDELELDPNCKDPVVLQDYDSFDVINRFQLMMNVIYGYKFGDLTDEEYDKQFAEDLARVKLQSR